ncbi:glycosyltransferase [bacterium]|nr:glycosyltransferase [bacterium]
MTNPIISIIVPIYNTEAYLRKCLDSLVEQTLKEIEIILVNDGSTDNSGKICDEYAKKDKRIKVIYHENKGVAGARNSGMKVAKGEFLTFVDSDDYVSKEYIGKMLEYYKKYPVADVVIFGQVRIVGKRTTIYIPEEEALMDRKKFSENFFEFRKKNLLDVTTNKLYRTSLAKTLKFTPDIQPGEDSLFNFQYYTLCKKIVLSKEYGYFVIRRNSSIMGQLYSRYYPSFELQKSLEMHKSFRKAFAEIGILPTIIEERYINLYPRWFYSVLSNVIKKETPYTTIEQIKKIRKIMDYHKKEGIKKENLKKGSLSRFLQLCYLLKHPLLIWIFLKVFSFYSKLKSKLKKAIKLIIN